MAKLFDFKVEILAGVLGWIDITTDVRGAITITRKSSDGQRNTPGRCSLRLNNTTGRYSARNPLSDLYGLIGRNTPLRVSAGPTGGALVGRFWGEVPAWPPRWSLSGTDRYVDLDVAGILQRPGQGTPPSWSPMRRTIDATGPAAYWPGEDGELAGAAGSASSAQSPMQAVGVVEFKSVADFAPFNLLTRYGTIALANLAAGGSLSATLPGDAVAATSGGSWTVHVAILVDITSALSGDVVLLEWTTTGGTYTRWQIRIPTTNRLQVVGFTPSGASTLLIDDSGSSTTFHHYAVSASVSGGTVTVRLQSSAFGTLTTTFSGSIGAVTTVAVNPTGVTSSVDMPAGHVAVWGVAPLPIVTEGAYDAFGSFVVESRRSYLGEDAGNRLVRLAGEAGISATTVSGTDPSGTPMGHQQAGTLLELIADAAEADGGLLYEARAAGQLVYRRRSSLYNQTPVTVSYIGQVVPPFDPVPSGDDVRNDVEVKRVNGSSARAIQLDGPLSVLPPPTGVGPYQTSVELNLLSDAQLPSQASWRRHLGTVDEDSYPAITVQLASPDWVAAPALRAQLLALDLGGVLAVAQLPAWVPGPARMLITEYTERIDEYLWSITFGGDPASPWDVAVWDVSRYDTEGSETTASFVAGTGTTLTVATLTGATWTTVDGPFDINAGGVRLTVTAVSGTASPQTFTVAQAPVNGVVKTIPAGTPVRLWQPAVYAL